MGLIAGVGDFGLTELRETTVEEAANVNRDKIIVVTKTSEATSSATIATSAALTATTKASQVSTDATTASNAASTAITKATQTATDSANAISSATIASQKATQASADAATASAAALTVIQNAEIASTCAIIAQNIADSIGDKMQFIESVSSLKLYLSADQVVFDGSIWDRKSGNKQSNGGDYAGTIVRVNNTFYWERDCEYVTPEMFGAKRDGVTDDIIAINNACSSDIPQNVIFQEGNYNITSEIIVNGKNLRGVKDKTFIRSFGCNAFRCVKNTKNKIEGFYLIEFSPEGSIDSKNFSGIVFDGSSGNGNSSYGNTIRDVICRGFRNGFLLNYCWDSVFDNVRTFFVENGFKIFGQSVNNYISNSNCSCIENGIWTMKDFVTRGEGLAIVNSTFVASKIGLKSDGFLLIQVSNSVFDQIVDICFDLTAVQNFKLSNSWLYSNNESIVMQDLGTILEINSSISNNVIESVLKGNIIIGANNTHVGISNNTIISKSIVGISMPPNFSVKAQLGSKIISITDNQIQSGYEGDNIFLGGEKSLVSGNIGDARVRNYDPSMRNIVQQNNADPIVTKGISAPSSGTWQRGDIVQNTLPVIGGHIGWVCTTPGTPGIWYAFGKIEQ